MIGIPVNVLRKLFGEVYFINGTGYAGKSTMVHMLAENYNGVCCGENFNEKLLHLIDSDVQPNLGYFDTMSDWQAFVNRTPEEYEAWYDGCSKEGAALEIIELIRRTEEGEKVFVDTNMPLSVLREISDYNHVAIMLSDLEVTVKRFFDRPDAEKQFLYRTIMSSSQPEKTLANFRACIERVNSPERYRAFEESGFFVLKRDEIRTPEQTMKILAAHFGL